MSTAALNIGFIGLGIMGAPMAGHLRAAGASRTLEVHGERMIKRTFNPGGEDIVVAQMARNSSGRTRRLSAWPHLPQRMRASRCPRQGAASGPWTR